MPVILFWEWAQGVDRVRPLSRVVDAMVKAVNTDRDRIKGVDLVFTEGDVRDAFTVLMADPSEVNFRYPLNDGYELVAHRDINSLYGTMHVERPWGKSTRILGEGWWFSVEVSV